MGGVVSRARGYFFTRSLQRFNIEARTERLLDKDPKPAPKYASDVKAREKLRKEHPEIVEAITKKDDVLHDRLKKVYVTSRDPDEFDPDAVGLGVERHPDRPLPEKIAPEVRFAHEYVHPFSAKDVPEPKGKVFLDTAQHIVAQARIKPQEFTPEFVAKEYSLSLDDSKGLIRHFGVFKLWTAPEADNAGKRVLDPLMAGPDWEEAKEEPKKTPLLSADSKSSKKKE